MRYSLSTFIRVRRSIWATAALMGLAGLVLTALRVRLASGQPLYLRKR